MLSSELAHLAGVTVRTLRHYHQIGVLPEPRRSSAGYRHYDVSHLVRLLRITRMTALGVPLSVLPEVLDDPSAAEELLDELDRQAAAEIEELTARRVNIAALRHTGAPPDLPPEFSQLRSAPEQTSADVLHREHAQLVLVGGLLGQAGRAALTDLLREAGVGGTDFAELTARFYALEPESPEEEAAAVIDGVAALLEPVAERVHALSPVDPQGPGLFDELNEQSLNPAQQRVLRVLQQRLTTPDEH